MSAVWRHAVDGTRPDWWTGCLLPWFWVEFSIYAAGEVIALIWWLA